MTGSPSEGVVDRRGRRVRLGVIVAVVVAVMAVAAVVQNRRVDDFEHTITRVQVEGRGVGDAIDPLTFRQAWAERVSGGAAGGAGGVLALAPHLDGADVVNVDVSGDPLVVKIDYQVSGAGGQACVRVARSAAGTDVTEAEVDCNSFTFTGLP
jgi:hypothetical protein